MGAGFVGYVVGQACMETINVGTVTEQEDAKNVVGAVCLIPPPAAAQLELSLFLQEHRTSLIQPTSEWL